MRYIKLLYLKYFLRKLPKTVEICLRKIATGPILFLVSVEKEKRLKKKVETGTFENAAHYFALRVTNKLGEESDKRVKSWTPLEMDMKAFGFF